jgi:hypothetical protein
MGFWFWVELEEAGDCAQALRAITTMTKRDSNLPNVPKDRMSILSSLL